MSTPRSVVIVGSGPAGYTAAIYAARAGLEPLVIAGSITAGGALVNTTEVENFPGFPDGIMGPDLMTNMEEQATKHGAEIVYDDVVEMDLEQSIKKLTTGDGTVVETRAVILAMGAQHRHLGVIGEERLGGYGVSYCATCDAPFFSGKDVIVVGGGDSALEEATFLSKFANSVTLVHRRDSLRASMAMQSKFFANEKCSVLWNTEVVAFKGDDKLSSVMLRDNLTDSILVKNVDGAFIAVGHDPRSSLVAGQVATDQDGYVVTLGKTTSVLTSTDMLGTALPGVFACGDLVDKTYRQAVTAAGSGCAAALDAQRYLEGITS